MKGIGVAPATPLPKNGVAGPNKKKLKIKK
jgi:hypothetical protein